MKAKTRWCKDGDREYLMAWIRCPGCDDYHAVPTDSPRGWTFNGDTERPTLTPSLLVRQRSGGEVCHSFVTDGKIQFLSDSTHSLAGQTVELPEIDLNFNVEG